MCVHISSLPSPIFPAYINLLCVLLDVGNVSGSLTHYFRSHESEMGQEIAERKVKQLESDKMELERKYEDMSAKYNEVKSELATTLQGLEDL